eukprot:gene1083-15416_t
MYQCDSSDRTRGQKLDLPFGRFGATNICPPPPCSGFDAGTPKIPSSFKVPQSTLSFEGTDLQGEVQISEKLKGLPFQKVEHSVTTVDVQPTVDNGLIVFVIGQLKTDSDPPHGFSQVFHLKQNPVTNSLVVLNDIFRLMLHHG